MLPPTRQLRRAHRPGARFGQGGIIPPYVSVADLDDLDAKMRHFNADVTALDAGPVPTPDTPEWLAWWKRSRAIGDFRWDWAVFYTQWGQWRDDHYGEWSRLGDTVRQEFDNWIAGFNERVRLVKANFGETTTTVTPTKPAGKKAAGELDTIADTIKLAIVAFVAWQIFKEVRARK